MCLDHFRSNCFMIAVELKETRPLWKNFFSLIEIIGALFKEQNNNRNNKQTKTSGRHMLDLGPQLWKTYRCGGSHRHVQRPKHSKDASDRSKTDFPRPSDNGPRFHFRPVLILFVSSEKLVLDPSPLSQTARVSTCLCERVCVHEYSGAQTHTPALPAY